MVKYMEKVRGLILTEMDNVAIVLSNCKLGEKIECGAVEVTLRNDIQFGHKVAFKEIHIGEPIIKYGHPIGVASHEITQGDHIHVHNVVGHSPSLRGQEEE
jgi:hypothetical protein